MALPSKPHFGGYDYFRENGDEIADLIGSAAGSYFVSGLKVVGPRVQGWTASIGGTDGKSKAGVNGTFDAGSFVTTSALTLSTACLALATAFYLLNKNFAQLQADVTAHGLIGTTIS